MIRYQEQEQGRRESWTTPDGGGCIYSRRSRPVSPRLSERAENTLRADSRQKLGKSRSLTGLQNHTEAHDGLGAATHHKNESRTCKSKRRGLYPPRNHRMRSRESLSTLAETVSWGNAHPWQSRWRRELDARLSRWSGTGIGGKPAAPFGCGWRLIKFSANLIPPYLNHQWTIVAESLCRSCLWSNVLFHCIRDLIVKIKRNSFFF